MFAEPGGQASQALPSSLRKQGPIRRDGRSDKGSISSVSLNTSGGGYGSLLSQGRRTLRIPSPGPVFLSEFKNFTRARHIRPGAVEVRDQRLHGFAVHGAIERGAVGELIGRLMNGRIAHAPEPPRLVDPERLHRIRQMLLTIPVVEGSAAGRIGDGGADDKISRRHGVLPERIALNPAAARHDGGA